MTVFSLTVGLVVRRGERTYQLEREVEGQAGDRTLVFQDQLTGSPWSTTRAELWRSLEGGSLSIVSGHRAQEAAGGVQPGRLVFSWSSVPVKYREDIERKVAFIRAARKAGVRKGQRRQLDNVIQRVAMERGEPKAPGASAVMAWMRAFERGGDSPAALLSGYMNRRPVRRLNDSLLNLGRRALSTFYCTRHRPTLTQTLIQANQSVARAKSEGTLPEDTEPLTFATLRRLRSEISPYIIDMKRYGAAFARNKWRYAKGGVNCSRAMQRYEIDHTVLDVVVVCDRTGLPLGRPTLTVVVDSFSGYVVGWFLSFWGTGLATSFNALKVAIKPKDDLRTVIPGLKNRWLGMGIPEELAVDNGLEFHSPQFRQIAISLSFDLQYCAVRQPWLKPVVERTLGEVLTYLPFQGRVRKSLPNEIPLDPDKSAAVTFGDLARGLMIVFSDLMPFGEDQRRLARSYDLFAESLDSLPPPLLPAGTQDLDIIIAPSWRLTVGKEGVVTQYLRFNDDGLQAMRRRIGTTFQTVVKINPDDLGYAWVQDPTAGGWLMVPNTNPVYADALSLVQHRAIRAHKRAELSRRSSEDVLNQGKAELMEMWRTRSHHSRRLKATQLKALANMTSAHSLRTESTGDAPSPTLSSRLVTESDMAAAPREIPTFDSFSM